MRLTYRGAVPIVFVADGLPEWLPGAELSVADALGKKILAENPGLFTEVRAEAPPAPEASEPAPKTSGKGSAAADGGEKAVSNA